MADAPEWLTEQAAANRHRRYANRSDLESSNTDTADLLARIDKNSLPKATGSLHGDVDPLWQASNPNSVPGSAGSGNRNVTSILTCPTGSLFCRIPPCRRRGEKNKRPKVDDPQENAGTRSSTAKCRS